MEFLASFPEIHLFNNLIQLFLLYVTFYIIKKCYFYLRVIVLLSKFPGTKRPFIFGDTFHLLQTPDVLHSSLRKWSEEFYPHYTLRLFHCMTLQIVSPEDCEILLGSKSCTSRRGVYTILRKWLRGGLLTSDGTKWLNRRRILTPAFHFTILKSFVHTFNEETDRVIEKIIEIDSEPIDVLEMCQDFALLTINESSFGYKLDLNDENHRQYRKAIRDMADIHFHKTMSPIPNESFLWMFTRIGQYENDLIKISQNFTKAIVNERINSFESLSVEQRQNDEEDDCIYLNPEKKKLAMLDILLHAKFEGEDIDFEGVCEEVDVFMFGGHDTTGTAIAFCLMLLANHPEIQEKIYMETEMILGENKQKPNYNDLQQMEFLERCIKESLRLYPSGHLISRRVETDVVLNSGLTCPKDTLVNIHIFDIHRNPKFFPNPEKYDPDRFLPENSRNRHPYAYIPFSAGPRNCIGQKFAILEMKALISGLIRNFKLLPVDKPESVVLKVGMILRIENGVRVKFIQRT